MEYYLVSIKYTKKSELFITFWRPNNAGYTYFKECAGIYTEIEDGYHRSENTIPVVCSIVDRLFEQPPDNWDKGLVVRNNKQNREILGLI